MATLSAPSLPDRMHGAVDFFEALTPPACCPNGPWRGPPPGAATAWHGRAGLARTAPGTDGAWRGRRLRLCDASSLSQAGGKGADWRIHAVYDLERGGFSHLDLTDGRGAKAIHRGPPVHGEAMIAIADTPNPPRRRRFWTRRAGSGAISSCEPGGTCFARRRGRARRSSGSRI